MVAFTPPNSKKPKRDKPDAKDAARLCKDHYSGSAKQGFRRDHPPYNKSQRK